MAGVRVSLQPVFTLKKALMKVKDKLPRKDRAGVVYADAVPCGCAAEYVEETGRTGSTLMARLITPDCVYLQ